MGMKTELETEVAKIFADQWSMRDGQKVPEDGDLKLSNDSVQLQATVLYADISDSTKLVDSYKPFFAAEIYKSFLRAAVRIIRAHDGAITAYDGDRVMAVYIGSSKNTNAVKSGLKLNWAAKNIIQPGIKKQYSDTTFEIKHTVGIDTSDLWVINVGIRGSNDLAWIGRSANHAAKLCSLSHDYPTRISEDVYSHMNDEAKFGKDGRSMWDTSTWTEMNNKTIYRSNWWWSFE
jgi:class 3 adenylate cyclase